MGPLKDTHRVHELHVGKLAKCEGPAITIPFRSQISWTFIESEQTCVY